MQCCEYCLWKIRRERSRYGSVPTLSTQLQIVLVWELGSCTFSDQIFYIQRCSINKILFPYKCQHSNFENCQARLHVPKLVLEEITALNILDMELYKYAQGIFAKQHRHMLLKLAAPVSSSFLRLYIKVLVCDSTSSSLLQYYRSKLHISLFALWLPEFIFQQINGPIIHPLSDNVFLSNCLDSKKNYGWKVYLCL